MRKKDWDSKVDSEREKKLREGAAVPNVRQQTFVVSRLEPEQKTPPHEVGGESQRRVRIMLPHVRSYEPQRPCV